MTRRLIVILVVLTGRATRSMNVTTSENVTKIEDVISRKNVPVDTTVTQQQIAVLMKDNVDPIDLPADLEIHNILIEISNRIFRSNDSELLTLIKKSIVEAAKANTATTKTSIEAGAKKAQRIVTDVTAAYTQATFRANTAQEVREILLRFQNTVQLIIDYAKNGQFAM